MIHCGLFYTQKSMLVRQGLIKNSPFLTCKQICNVHFVYRQIDTGKSLSEALILAEHGENMLCTIIVLNVKNNFYTQHVLPLF